MFCDKGRGDTVSLPSSYFILNSCLCPWEGGLGCAKREGKEMKFSRYCTLYAPNSHAELWFILTAIRSTLLVYCLSDSEWEASLSILPFFLWLTWQQQPHSCQLACFQLLEWWLISGEQRMPYWMDCPTVPTVSLFSRDDASVMWVFSLAGSERFFSLQLLLLVYFLREQWNMCLWLQDSGYWICVHCRVRHTLHWSRYTP